MWTSSDLLQLLLCPVLTWTLTSVDFTRVSCPLGTYITLWNCLSLKYSGLWLPGLTTRCQLLAHLDESPLPLTNYLCDCLQAFLQHWETCFLSQHHLCLCGASSSRFTYLWILQEARRRKACKCTFGLAPLGAHIKITSLRVAGRSSSLNTGRSLASRANWGLRLSVSYSPLQVLLWNSCERKNALMAYKMYTSECAHRFAFDGRVLVLLRFKVLCSLMRE